MFYRKRSGNVLIARKRVLYLGITFFSFFFQKHRTIEGFVETLREVVKYCLCAPTNRYSRYDYGRDMHF